MNNIDPAILRRAKKWLQEPFDLETQREVQRLIDSDPKGLTDAFFKELSFGTGGMRGIMGVGTNRLNLYTIRMATQGLAHYLLNQAPQEHSVFIGYDVRHHSKEFAVAAARVLAAAGIRAYISKEICPTPLASFACRHFQCSAAIQITASHNPPQYNGYKVYWSDGGQVVFPHDEGIMAEVAKIDLPGPLAPEDSPLIHWVGHELDEAYLAKLKELQLYPDLDGKKIHLLYSPLHGTGARLLPAALQTLGYSSLHWVEDQKKADGNFTHAPSPNPEDPKAMQEGSKILEHTKYDLFIATDPDADRLGVVVLDRGRSLPLTGNQTACLCLFHICSALTERGEFPPNAAFIKTIVTTELFAVIAKHFGGKCFDVLTGFKYIAEQISLWEHSFDAPQYIFGAEESYGSLFGTNIARDKDAISSSCLVAEAALLAKKQNITLADRLIQIYEKFGVHREALKNLAFPEGAAGMEEMKALMQKLRKHPPKAISGIKITSTEDYLEKVPSALSLPKSDVLRYWLADGSKLVIRPSGTEPKVKIYAEVMEKNPQDVEKAIAACDRRLHTLIDSFQNEVCI